MEHMPSPLTGHGGLARSTTSGKDNIPLHFSSQHHCNLFLDMCLDKHILFFKKKKKRERDSSFIMYMEHLPFFFVLPAKIFGKSFFLFIVLLLVLAAQPPSRV